MHISFKIIKFYVTLCCSTCFGHHCVHHQELLIAAHALVTLWCWVGCFLQPVHLVGFYSILSLMMHGTMNMKLPKILRWSTSLNICLSFC
jgi:hypothetical protein